MNLSGTQLKDTYGNLVTTGTSAGSPTTGGLQNGDGQLLTQVGIGTNSPSHILDIESANSPQLRITDTTNDVAFKVYAQDADVFMGTHSNHALRIATNNDEKLRIEADGDIAFYDDANNQGLFWDASTARLGIGTQTPDVAIHAQDSGTIEIKADSTGGYATLRADAAVVGGASVRFDKAGTEKVRIEVPPNSDDLRIRMGTSEKMRLDTSGNLGINATAENSSGTWRNYQLGSLSMAGRANDVNPDAMFGTNFKFTTANAEQRISAHATSRMFFNDDVITFQNAGSDTAGSTISWNERMRIDSNGDTTHIASYGGGTFPFRVGFGTYASFTPTFLIDDTGAVGIGTTSPSYALDVTGDIALSNDLYVSNGNFIKLQRNSGGLYLDVLGTPSGTDDVRLLTSGAFDLVNGSLTSMLKVDSSGNVGIGGSPSTFANYTNVSIKGGSSGSNLDFLNSSGTRVGAIVSNPSTDLILETNESTPLVFKTNDNTAMTIDSSGNVGIGSDDPDNKLVVADSNGAGLEIIPQTSNDRTTLLSYDRNASTYQTLDFDSSDVHFNISGSEKVRIDSSGNVGIGETNPTAPLQIKTATSAGGAKVAQFLTHADTTSGTEVRLAFAAHTNIDVATDRYSYISALNTSGSNGQALVFATNEAGAGGSEKMRIDSSGNVGINYNNGAIHTYGSGVFGGKAVIKASSDNALALLNSTTGGSAQVALNFTNEFTTNQYNYLARIVAKPAQAWSSDAATRDSDLIFSTTLNGVTAERMRILSGGDVSFAMQDFSASPSNTVYGLRLITGAAGKSYWKSAVNADTTHYHYEFLNTNGSVGNISTSASATAYNTSSDYRLKENVVEMTGALDRVDQLKPSRFNFIADANTTVDGFLAHEVADVVPEAISGEKDATEEYEVTPAVLDDEGNVIEEAVMGTRPVYQGIDQSKLVPLLVGAIQELRAEIEQLKNQ